jgi:hypothetical protein
MMDAGLPGYEHTISPFGGSRIVKRALNTQHYASGRKVVASITSEERSTSIIRVTKIGEL